MGNFDEFFKKEADGKEGDEKEADREKTQPEIPAPPSESPSKTNDQLLGDFDSIFEQAQKEPPPPPPPKPAQTPQPAPKKEDPVLEDLLVEVSQQTSVPASVSEEDEEGEEAEPEEEAAVPKKKIPKAVWIGGLSLVGLAAAAGAFFFFTGGEKTEGYRPPDAETLARLDKDSAAAAAYLMDDTAEAYAKAISGFEGILKQDPRHSPTDSLLAEAVVLSHESLDEASRKKAEALLKQSEADHPGTAETLRAAARLSFASGKTAQAESQVKRALAVRAGDPSARVLLGEVAAARSDWSAAAQEFSAALSSAPASARARYFMAVADLQRGKTAEAESSLQNLAATGHPKAEIDLWRLAYVNRGKVEEAREGLEKLTREKAAKLSGHDLGRAYRYLAEISEAKGDVSAAAGIMETSVEKDPAAHANIFYLGRLYLMRKEPAKAAERFGRAAGLAPDRADYWIYSGRARLEEGKPDMALADLSKGIEKSAGNVDGLYYLGIAQRRLGLLNEAAVSLETALKNDSHHLESMIALGEIYAEKNDFTAAQARFRAALAQDPSTDQAMRAHNSLGEALLATRKRDEAFAEFRRAEKLAPGNIAVLVNLGRAYLASERPDQASVYLQKALSLDPARPETLTALGELQRRRKEYTQAAETLRKVLEQRPKDAVARVKLAAVQIDQQAYPQAIAELQEVFKHKADDYSAKLYLGIAQRGLGDLEASLAALNAAKQIRPDAAEAHYQLELTHIYRNDIVSAEKEMDQAVRGDPSYADPWTAMGDYYSGKNAYDRAAEYYSRAAQARPKDGNLLYQLAEAYRRDDKPKLAKQWFEKTVLADPKNDDAYLGLGLLAEENRQRDAAIRYYKRAQAANPDNPKPYYYLGFIYKELGRNGEAVSSFRTYLKLDPDSKERADIEEEIRKLNGLR